MSSAYSQLKINHCKNGMNFRTRLTCSSIPQTVTTLIYSHILSEAYLTAANLVQLAISIRYYVYTGSQYLLRLNSLRWITADHKIHPLLKTSTPTGIEPTPHRNSVSKASGLLVHATISVKKGFYIKFIQNIFFKFSARLLFFTLNNVR